MPFGHKGPTLTGADFIIAIADESRKSGHPYAERFLQMAMEAFDDQAPVLSTEAVAQRSLKEYEATPVAVILGAWRAAAVRGDKESPMEVLKVGLMLLAKWSEYLVISADGHPRLQWKQDDSTARTSRSPNQ